MVGAGGDRKSAIAWRHRTGLVGKEALDDTEKRFRLSRPAGQAFGGLQACAPPLAGCDGGTSGGPGIDRSGDASASSMGRLGDSNAGVRDPCGAGRVRGGVQGTTGLEAVAQFPCAGDQSVHEPVLSQRDIERADRWNPGSIDRSSRGVARGSASATRWRMAASPQRLPGRCVEMADWSEHPVLPRCGLGSGDQPYVAAIDGRAAEALGLPPVVDLAFGTDVEGALGTPSFRLRRWWSKFGREQMPRRVGAILGGIESLARIIHQAAYPMLEQLSISMSCRMFQTIPQVADCAGRALACLLALWAHMLAPP